MKIVLLGAPGCGKGTQSPIIKEKYGICHLSTGDMLREAVAAKTANGLRAKDAMDNGRLVTDDIVFGIVKDALVKPECKKGYIIDGLPRTLTQAKAMTDMGIEVDKTLHFQVPDDVILERTSGRWLHRPSGRTYHEKFAPPKVPFTDDVTGEPLTQRPDDKREVCAKRLVIYHKEVDPIADYYKKAGVYTSIDGNRPAAEVRASVLEALEGTKVRPWFQFWKGQQ